MKAKKEKKKITLREYHKKRMVTGIAILVTEIFENTAEQNHIKPVIAYSFSVTLNLPKISENKVITEINRQAIVNRNVIKV